MTLVTFVQKNRYVLAVTVLVLLALFYLREDLGTVSLSFLLGKPQPIGSYLSCSKNPLLEKGVLAIPKKENDQIRLLVHFNEKPSIDARDYFASKGIVLYLDTWIMDYAVVETPVSKLCFLADQAGIIGISVGEL